MSKKKLKVLFVCLGNICRSPMAHAIFEEKINNKGLSDQIEADSAGTSRYHLGDQPDPRTLDTLSNHQINFRHAARQINPNDAIEFDYILAMDSSNKADIINVIDTKKTNLRLMRDFDELNKGADVPDPYFGGSDGFENVYEMLDRSLDIFIDQILEDHKI